MKKLINDPSTVVSDALAGIEAAHPELRVDHDHKVIYRGDAPVHAKVGIISGGGSGHEPLHGGFVGRVGREQTVERPHCADKLPPCLTQLR